ncbi:hypothetical protein V6N11_051840 [Hibiscus sabdariffa]|uniref:Uncharacterized protein n=1 Tax=Hibiscus sabdariffa TaxID=183260 RepID=A0ABR2U913_9ROSI
MGQEDYFSILTARSLGLDIAKDTLVNSVEHNVRKVYCNIHIYRVKDAMVGCTLCMTRDKPKGPLLPLVSEIERLFHQRKRENKAQRAMHRGDEPVDGEENRNTAAIGRSRAIRDHLTPILDDLNKGQ